MLHQDFPNKHRNSGARYPLHRAAVALSTAISILLAIGGHSVHATPEPIRVYTDFQFPVEIPDRTNAHLRNLTDTALTELKRFVQVKEPVNGNLSVPRGITRYFRCRPPPSDDSGCDDNGCPIELSRVCNRAVEKEALHKPTFVCHWACKGGCGYVGGDAEPQNADLLLYVTADGTAPECADQMNKTTIVHGEACQHHPNTSRPLSGSINFCPQVALPVNTSDTALSHHDALGTKLAYGRQLDHIVHELIHVLGFDIESLQEQNLLTTVHRAEYGMVQHMNGSEVAQFAASHFDCSSATGVDLENEQLPDNAAYENSTRKRTKAHWEFRLTDDLMVAASDASQLGRQPLTTLTLAMLNDTGWYVTNKSAAARPVAGKAKGCTIFDNSCGNVNSTDTDFCVSSNDQQCTRSQVGIGNCTAHPLADGCSVPVYQYQGSCGNTFTGKQHTLFGQWRSLQASMCMATQHESFMRVYDGSMYSFPGASHGCFETECSNDGSQLTIQIPSCNNFEPLRGEPGCAQSGGATFPNSTVNLTCNSAGETLTLEQTGAADELGYIAGTIVCPDPAKACSITKCPKRCSEQGACDPASGECKCFVGFAGSDCSIPSCNSYSCGAASKCNFQTGQCETS